MKPGDARAVGVDETAQGERIVEVDGIRVRIEGQGGQAIVMIPGWPDTDRLWDAQVRAFCECYRCARFTLPGFDVDLPPRPVSLRLRDKLLIAGYQFWLALAWKIGGAPVDWMKRQMVAAARSPGEPARIRAQMNYPYFVRCFGALGGYGDARPPAPAAQCPMLFLYGRRKPFMFHSPAFAQQPASLPGCAVYGLRAGHWVMTDQPEEFNRIVLDWLETDPVPTAAGS